MVKADAYGHGLRAIEAFSDADAFAVSSIGEALEVREYTDKPIDILSSPDRTAPHVYPEGVFPSVSSADDVAFVAAFGATQINVKVNSGMNRYGADKNDLPELFRSAERAGLKIRSAFSHIYDISAAEEQFARFMRDIAPYASVVPQKHILSSNFAVLPAYMHLDMVRPGIVLYGYGHGLTESAITATCGVTCVREVSANENIGYGIAPSGKARKIAVLGAGYADGCRRIQNGAPRYVEIGGMLCPVVGQICMDAMMTDVSGLDVRVGDTATVLGTNYGCESVAASADTICYEILTGIGKRVPRLYEW